MPLDPTPMSPAGRAVRRRIRVGGIVQGVGFRPFVYRLATELDLSGWVLNDASGVTIEIEGPHAAVGAFEKRLPDEAPPLSSIAVHPWPPGFVDETARTRGDLKERYAALVAGQ